MKIALLHYTSPPIVGGVESVIGHQARLMKEDGQTVVIFSGRGEIFDSNIPVVQLPLLDSRNREVLNMKKELDLGHHFPAFDILRDKIRKILLENLQGFDILIAHNVVSLHKNLPLTAALFDAYTSTGFPHLILWHHDLAWTTPELPSNARHDLKLAY